MIFTSILKKEEISVDFEQAKYCQTKITTIHETELNMMQNAMVCPNDKAVLILPSYQ